MSIESIMRTLNAMRPRVAAALAMASIALAPPALAWQTETPPAGTPTSPAAPAGPAAPTSPATPVNPAPVSPTPAVPIPGAPAPGTKPAPEAVPNPPTVPTATDVVEAKPRTDLPRQRVVLFGETFDAELCLEDATRNLGMGGRDAFPEGTAMIFVHPRPRMLNYWMKDCLIDMDMIFVDATGRVASFHEAKRERLRSRSESVAAYEARLPRYGPRQLAQFVIELPPGSIRRLKPSIGQQVTVDWPALVRRAR